MVKETLHSKYKYPILTLFIIGWSILIWFSDYLGVSHPWLTAIAILVEFTFVYFSLTSVDVIITDNEIIKGTNYFLIPGLKQTNKPDESQGFSRVTLKTR
jgi:hypothetical protein